MVLRATTNEAEVKKYLEDRHIPELLERLMSLLLIHRPENPREFVLEQLLAIRDAKVLGTSEDAEAPLSLFSKTDLHAIFRIMDTTGTNFISLKQYKEAMKNIGVENPNPEPFGYERDRIVMDTFVQQAYDSKEVHSFNVF